MIRLNTYIESERVRYHGSLAEMCDKIGISRMSFYNKQSGRSDWTIDELGRMAKLGILDASVVASILKEEWSK